MLAARQLAPVVERLREALPLGEPFHDEGVGVFGLQNAVFALGDTFLEVVSPVRPDTAAGRLLERRGEDVCGYMLMFQVAALAPARSRAASEGVREVLAIEFEDIEEVHLHPRDMRGAIVSLSTPHPAAAWRWGGPEWPLRAAPLSVVGARVAVAEPEAVTRRWTAITGAVDGLDIAGDPREPGLVEVALRGEVDKPVPAIDFGGVRVVVV